MNYISDRYCQTFELLQKNLKIVAKRGYDIKLLVDDFQNKGHTLSGRWINYRKEYKMENTILVGVLIPIGIHGGQCSGCNRKG